VIEAAKAAAKLAAAKKKLKAAAAKKKPKAAAAKPKPKPKAAAAKPKPKPKAAAAKPKPKPKAAVAKPKKATKRGPASSYRGDPLQEFTSIADGDCLFASFAMAYSNQHFPSAVQRQAAAEVRQQVTEYMESPESQWLWDALTAIRTPLIDEVDKHLFEDLAPAADLRLAMRFPAPGARQAYINIMKVPRTWGSGTELQCLAKMYLVNIMVHQPDGHIVRIGEGYDETIHLKYLGECHYKPLLYV
jgi:hypothetical protein